MRWWVGGAASYSSLCLAGIIDGKMTYEVRMKLPCCTFTAMNLTYDWFNFPKNDDFSGFWTIGAMSPMGPVQREMVAWTALEEERSTFTTPPRCKRRWP